MNSPDSTPASRPALPAPRVAPAAVAATAIRVLIVDDNPDIRLLVRMTLTYSDGIEVCAEATDGVEAVERWSEHRPDVVIMDLGLPRMGGLAAAQLIRGKDPSALIILFSATPSAYTDSADLHCSSFLIKEELASLPAEVRRLADVQRTLRIVKPALR